MKQLIDCKDMSRSVLECVSAPETIAVFDTETSDFIRGARWGMAWAAMYANTHCPCYVVEEENNTDEKI